VAEVGAEVPSSSHGAGDERSRGFGGGSKGGRRRTGKDGGDGLEGGEMWRSFIASELGVTSW
jgi:hypothetical protein